MLSTIGGSQVEVHASCMAFQFIYLNCQGAMPICSINLSCCAKRSAFQPHSAAPKQRAETCENSVSWIITEKIASTELWSSKVLGVRQQHKQCRALQALLHASTRPRQAASQSIKRSAQSPPCTMKRSPRPHSAKSSLSLSHSFGCTKGGSLPRTSRGRLSKRFGF